MSVVLALVVAGAAIFGLLSMVRQTQSTDLDQRALDHLRKSGSKLNKLHDIEFFLYFPNESSANVAAETLKEQGLAAKVQGGPDTDNWLCFATKSMIPNLPDLIRMRNRFEAVCSRYDGQYDGWGAAQVK